LLISAWILLDDGRPLFFRQKRAGLSRQPFEILKFRTMRDGKITRAGRWLRKSGLDELPQFLNILKGEMSYVGPRPLTEEDIARLGWQASRFQYRWRMKPGITGLAQIRAGEGARATLAWDRVYLSKMSPGFDTLILGVTFVMNLAGKTWVKRHVLGIGPPPALK
jgi:lipopolysaccharide/colanic/teichoic acid biosynthesis glycosyltransferase